jgi:predicted metal-dependent HD superfamily phosphohydrolase
LNALIFFIMLENDFFVALKAYVFDLFKNSLPTQVVYHNFNHTMRVVEASNEIAIAENISESELEILLMAAWFHDTGFTMSHKEHEEHSKEIASKFLKSKGVTDSKIKEVQSVIDATKMPQKPQSKMDKIICDADLFHLGSVDFKKKSNLLRSEWEQTCNHVKSDIEWYSSNEKFLAEHKYFTNDVYKKLGAQKTANWLKLKKDLKKAQQKENSKTSKIEKGEKKKNRSERGIETMFRVTLKNHIKLSDIADTKANILLSVSAITLSIALTVLFPKLDKADNDYLIYPTVLFILVSVTTMIFSILSTRPKVTSGTFTQEDVANRKVNLLFFGNFYKMSLKDFQGGMTEMMNDRDYLYKSLMKDLYFLGLVLNKKYRLLRVAYTIFMIGIIVSVVAFLLSFALLEI